MVTNAARQAACARRPAVPAAVPVLESKITGPDEPGWAVRRPRLTALIAEGTRWCPLTVLTAPAGAGKTTALALWSAAEPGPVAWLRVDEFDNRPGVFWAYVVAALRRSGAVIPVASPVVRGRDGGHVFLLWLAAALAAQDPPVTLVLDDMHLLTDPEVLDGLAYLLRNTGAGLRLVVSARRDPLRLHRYRIAGQLTQIRASDLAFTTAEAGLLLAKHGITLTADVLECLTRRTEGWAAALRLAALRMRGYPEPDRLVTELITYNSPLTGYLVEEVLNPQPPDVRDVLLRTSILEQVSVQGAIELTGNEQAGEILSALADADAFVQRTGPGWYRYHTLFAEVLRLKLSREHPDRIASLQRQAALWHEQNGRLPDAVRHAARAGDWQLAAGVVIDQLAIGEIIAPRCGPSLAREFAGMPHGRAWTGAAPHVVSAAVAFSAGRHESSAAALDAAEGILARLPAEQEVACRLSAAMIRLAASRRTGDLAATASAAARAEALVSRLPGDKLARRCEIQARVLVSRGAVELWSGHLDEAVRVLESGVAAATTPGGEGERADCLGHLALAEALRGRLSRAATLAVEATKAPHPRPAALVALAWVHLERYELREAHSRLTQADAALGVTPDKLISAVARLTAAYRDLAKGRAAAAGQVIATARFGWSVPAWLDERLSVAESRAYAAAGAAASALAAAGRAGSDTSPEAAVALAYAWAAAGNGENARRILAPALATGSGMPNRVRLQAGLVESRLSYASGDRVRGRRSLASALQLGEREQLRLPFALERGWIEPVLRSEPELAQAHRRLLASTSCLTQVPPQGGPDQARVLMVETLTEREVEVLRHVSLLLSTAEVASELHISVNTLKSHLKNIYRKLAATRRGEAVRRARQLELI